MTPTITDIKTGFSVIYIAPKFMLRLPVGAAVWNTRKRWLSYEILHDEVERLLGERYGELSRLAEHSIESFVKQSYRQEVLPYAGDLIKPYTAKFWEHLRSLFSGAFRFSCPRAMADAETPSEAIEPILNLLKDEIERVIINPKF